MWHSRCGGVLCALVLISAHSAATADDAPWTAGLADHVLPGLIPAPAEIPGIGRWQVLSIPVNGYVEAVDVSPDGGRVAFPDGRYVRIHDAATFELTGALIGHRVNVRSVDWSRDGRWLATGADDGVIRIWTTDGALAHEIRDHIAPVRAAAWHPESQILATASEDGTIRFYSSDGTPGVVIEDHQAPVTTLDWSPDGQWLAAGDENRMIRWWSATGTAGPAVQSDFGGVVSVRWSPDGKWLASASSGITPAELGQQPVTTARLWAADGTEGAVLRGHTRSLRSVAWTADSRQLLTSAEDRSIRRWSLQGELQGVVDQGGADRNAVFALDRNPKTGEFVAGARFCVRTLTVDGPSGSDALNRRSGSKLMGVDWNPTRDLLAVAGGDGVLHILSADLKSDFATDAHAPSGITCVRWSPDGNVVATCGFDQVVRSWNSDAGKLREQQLDNPGSLHRSLSWTPDGRRLAVSFQFNGNILLLDDHHVIQTFARHADGGNLGISFAPDGLRLASGGSDTTLRITQFTEDGSGQSEIAVAEGLDGDIDSVAWSPDGNLIATGQTTGLKLWSPDGKEVVSIPGYTASVMALDWRPDSQALAAASWDTGADIWSTDGTLLVELPHHSAPCYAASFSPDGRRIATCGWDGLVRVLNAEDGSIEGLALFVAAEDTPIAEDSQNFRQSVIRFNAAGQILSGDRTVIERQLAYVVETPDGAMQVLKPSEFFKLASGAILVPEPAPAP